MYNGARKDVTYKKQVLGLDGRTIKKQKACVTIMVKPGMDCSHTMKLKGEGNQ